MKIKMVTRQLLRAKTDSWEELAQSMIKLKPTRILTYYKETMRSEDFRASLDPGFLFKRWSYKVSWLIEILIQDIKILKWSFSGSEYFPKLCEQNQVQPFISLHIDKMILSLTPFRQKLTRFTL